MSEQVVDKDGFGHWVGENTSTLFCPCGCRFEWEGYSENLEPWRARHRPHLPAEPAASTVAPSAVVALKLTLEEALALDYAIGNSMEDEEDLFPDPMERGVAWRGCEKLKEAIKKARRS